MKISKTLKKICAVIMTFAMLVGVAGGFGGEITAKASTTPVKMYYCDVELTWRGAVQYNVYIQIDASSAANKEVYVHHSTLDSEADWQDEKATFVTKLDANTEIWKATVSGFGVSQYAIKYVGDGQTYWDNNNGNNYTYEDILGEANVKVERLAYQSPSYFTVQAVVKNLAYTKVVKVRYTQDNWATYQDVELSYDSEIEGTNMERWSTVLNLDENKMDSFQYCVSYQVNGPTYWDNNFGQNYDQTFHKHP